jgi:acetyltransferase-like isoleucine patch superfamily enzyme
MSAKKNPISRFLFSGFQRLNGTAKFEAETLWDVFKGISGRFLQAIAMSFLPIPSAFRISLQRMRGVKIGKGVFLGPGVWIDNAKPELLEIRDSASLAGRVTVLTHSQPTMPLREILGPESKVASPTVIGRGAWITVNCVVLPGVEIGENTIVAAGSVVTKDLPAGVLAGGSPAKVIRNL